MKKIIKIYQNSLRKNLTDVEQILWSFLRNRKFYGFKFRRQFILVGYIVDFVCLEKKLIIELDGSQHFDQISYDNKRTDHLTQEGFRIIRFWNNDVINQREMVLGNIYENLFY